MTLRTLNYGNYGIFLIMGNAGFCPSTVVHPKPYTLIPEVVILEFQERALTRVPRARGFRFVELKVTISVSGLGFKVSDLVFGVWWVFGFGA